MRSESGSKTVATLARVWANVAKTHVLANVATCYLLTLFATQTAIGGEPPDPTAARLASVPAQARPISFVRDVSPALTKAGCNAGVCHGSFQGRGGFRLSLLGFDPEFDHEVLSKASRSRRVVPTAPESSLLLTKPVGEIPHGGGRRISRGSEVFAILRDWQLAGMPGPREGELNGIKLTAQPSDVTLMPNQSQTLTVQATFADGETRDVTAWALFDVRESHIAEVSRTGRITALRAGKTAVMVRYLGQVATISVAVPFSAEPVTIDFQPANFIDELVLAEWQRMRVRPAPLASDEEFVRRVGLDLIGTLPTPEEVRAFLADTSADKRAKWIDVLLARPELVDYWAMRWGDLLRSHRRYLGDKGLASFTGWLKQSLRENKPLDVMTRELLTAQGNLYANGAVGYFFIDEKVEDLAETTAQIFLGVRMQCTRCHHHPQEVWSQDDYWGLAAFFTRLESKDSGAYGARFGGPRSLRVAAKPNPNRPLAINVAPTAFRDLPPQFAPAEDPRVWLSQWMTRADNPYFARNMANRYWAALFGRGLVDPVDDLRATNPAAMPAVLDRLARELADHKFDAKHLLRVICNSRVYQLAGELQPSRDPDGQLCTHRVPRRLSAEVLLDAVSQVTGVPEAFDGQPLGTRAISLADPSFASTFLMTFGRPLRNNACDCARGGNPDLSQALHLVNSTTLHQKIISDNGRLAKLLKSNKPEPEVLEELYLATLSRRPHADELAAINELLREAPSRAEGLQDLLWTLLNSSEFVFNH